MPSSTSPSLPPASAGEEAWDDRIHCGMCRHADGIYCRAAKSGILHGTSKMASPMPISVKWRCEGFVPLPSLPDQRTGAQRWPRLAAGRRSA